MEIWRAHCICLLLYLIGVGPILFVSEKEGDGERNGKPTKLPIPRRMPATAAD